VVICLDRGADLHMAQLMPLLLTVSRFSKIQIGLPFWYRLTRVVPDQRPLNGCVCVCLVIGVQWCEHLTCSYYAATPRPGVKPTTSWSQVQMQIQSPNAVPIRLHFHTSLPYNFCSSNVSTYASSCLDFTLLFLH